MTLFSSRNKLVTFRLSQEEFEALKSFCIAKGVRSISELTRAAVLQQVSADRVTRTVCGDMETLISTLEHIDDTLKQLSLGISNALGPAYRRSHPSAGG